MNGAVQLVLHAHLPFVRHPENEYHLEENWLFEAILETYKELRVATANGQQEAFIETLRRVGHEPFKAAANAARHPAQDAETV